MSERFIGRPRHGRHEPITPAQGGRPPAWVVACLDCPFACDAHGLNAEDAVKAIAPIHERTHRLIARAVDYTQGWSRPGQPLAGVPATTGGHGLYFA
jgi:hypothetical protein